MRVRDAFEGLYGPDLIDTVKNGPEYYERVFADAGVPAEDAMVVDDSPAALGWASEVGATPVLVSEEGKPMSDTLHVRGLRELPDRLCALRASR
jgi:FMN phosphatase YigB (HAD superfamily)